MKQTPAPQYIGRFVSSNASIPNRWIATRLKIPEATHPTEPNIRIRGNCSEGAWLIAIVLVRLCVSDGPYREYTVGKLQLKFKHASNKDIAAKSYKTALIIQALKALGKERIDDSIKQKLASILSKDELTTAVSETQRGTVWIYEVLKSIADMEKEI